MWFAEHSPQRAKDLTIALHQTWRNLEQNPLLHRVQRGNWRMVQVPGFTYAVWYTVNERSHTVYVGSFLHQSRNPSIIAKRTHTRLR
jgi:plasmid stabilization system protein ParE